MARNTPQKALSNMAACPARVIISRSVAGWERLTLRLSVPPAASACNVVAPQTCRRTKELAARNGALAYPGGPLAPRQPGVSEKNLDDHQGDVIEERECLD